VPYFLTELPLAEARFHLDEAAACIGLHPDVCSVGRLTSCRAVVPRIPGNASDSTV